MNLKAIRFIKNMSFTVTSNLISLIVSTIIILTVPKLIGVEEYGYWQLYLFYSSYVGFLHFGWNDGIYLRYGGEEYRKLNKNIFFSQFLQLVVFQLVIGIIISVISALLVLDHNRSFIIQMVALSMILTNTRLMLFYILQATNRIKEYAQVTVLDRVVYVFFILTLLFIGVRDFKLMIIADILGKVFSLVLAMISCKEIIFNKLTDFVLTINETVTNVNVGIKLMFANIASILIVGIVRFGIERNWDVATFGKVSLTLSISNMMMIFINAVGIIMYPILRRTSQEKLANIYSTMRDFLMVILLGFLIIYYPLKTVMTAWLPQYAESLLYMSLVFPMFIYEGKMALLINTYLKTLRCEKVMLKINLISMMLSLFMTYLTTQIFVNLNMTILNIAILLTIRSTIAEIYLAKELKIRVNRDVALEVFLTIVFILSGWFVNSWMTMFIYGISYFIYLMIKRKDIAGTIKNIKLLMKA